MTIRNPRHKNGCAKGVFGVNCRVHPTAIIADDVVMGNNNSIGPSVIINAGVTIGDNNMIGPGVTIGLPSRTRITSQKNPVDCRYSDKVVIGDDNIIFEYVSIHAGLAYPTVVGSGVAIGARSHVAHDCTLRDGVILSVHCALGGYVTVGRNANLGINVSVHPRTAIGGVAMCGAGTVIVNHVVPGATVANIPAVYLHPNVRGMERCAYDEETIVWWVSLLCGGSSTATPPALVHLFKEFDEDRSKFARLRPAIPMVVAEPPR